MTRRAVLWALLLGVLVTAGQAALAQAPPAGGQAGGDQVPAIADVPPDHWAYQAVVTLVRRGYITLEANRFDGNRPVDRFTLATVVARLLNDLQQGQVQLSGEDLALVRRLTGEFREELARWEDQRASLRGQIDEQARNVSRIDRKLTEVMGAWQQQSEAHSQRLDQLEAQGRDLSDRLGRLEASSQAGLAQASQTLSGLREAVTQLQQRVDQLARETGLRLTAIQQEAQGLQQVAGRQQEDLNAQRQQLVSLGEQGEKARTRLDALEQQLQSLQALQKDLAQTSSRLDALQGQLSKDLGSLQGQVNQLAQTSSEEDQKLRDRLASLEASLNQSGQRFEQRAAALDARITRLESEGQAMARTAAAAEFRELLGRMGLEASGQQELARELNQLKEQNRLLTWAAVGGLVLAIVAIVTK